MMGGAAIAPPRTQGTALMKVTPDQMLGEFLKSADPYTKEQHELFKKMHPNKQRELLFFMCINTNIVLQRILMAMQPPQ